MERKVSPPPAIARNNPSNIEERSTARVVSKSPSPQRIRVVLSMVNGTSLDDRVVL
jgi:hypothetical protein